jgi:hypothetical protein
MGAVKGLGLGMAFQIYNTVSEASIVSPSTLLFFCEENG